MGWDGNITLGTLAAKGRCDSLPSCVTFLAMSVFSSSHQEVEPLPHTLALRWPCDLFWPAERGGSDVGAQAATGSLDQLSWTRLGHPAVGCKAVWSQAEGAHLSQPLSARPTGS